MAFYTGYGTNLKTKKVDVSVKKIKSNEVVETAVIPFMRSLKIYFRAWGLRPNTRHFPFFDGVRVDDFCREETYTTIAVDPTEYGNTYSTATSHPEGSSELYSDTEGTIEGSFFVPDSSVLPFNTGSNEFKLLDISVNDDDAAISSAFTIFIANGEIIKIRDTYLKTRTITPISKVGLDQKDTKYAYQDTSPGNGWVESQDGVWSKD